MQRKHEYLMCTVDREQEGFELCGSTYTRVFFR